MEATIKQLNFMQSLARERVVPDEKLAQIDRELEGLTKKRASEFIDDLLKLPKSAPVAAKAHNPRLAEVAALVPAGAYAIVDGESTDFYEVDKPTRGRWAGRVFVSRLTGDNHEPVRNDAARIAILEAIGLDVEAAVRRYGQLKKHCGFCKINLTDQFSRFYGVGPVCRRNHGMPISEAAYRRTADVAQLADLDSFIAEDRRLEHKAAFAAQEREQENAAYAAKMRRDEQLFATGA